MYDVEIGWGAEGETECECETLEEAIACIQMSVKNAEECDLTIHYIIIQLRNGDSHGQIRSRPNDDEGI